MHEYYRQNAPKFKKAMSGYLKLISKELEQKSGKTYSAVFEEIWQHYEKNMLENFPYIGGDSASGTNNLTGSYYFVSMGEVLKGHGVSPEDIGHLMVLSYERKVSSMPGIVKTIMHKLFTNVKLLNKMFRKKDVQNAANAAENPGSFETKTMISPEKAMISAITTWSARWLTSQGPMAMRNICPISAALTMLCTAS